MIGTAILYHLPLVTVSKFSVVFSLNIKKTF